MPGLDQPDIVAMLTGLLVAAAVGFLVGFEREWVHAEEERRHTFAGARTFTLIGLVGGLAGYPGNTLLLAAAFLGVAGLTIVSYWVQTQESESRGGTTEMAVFAVFLLGAAATRGHLMLAVVGGVSVAVILSLKNTLTRLAESLSEREIHAALRLLAISVLVLPILPNQGYGPYDALNPREIWLMVVFISALSFLGYWLSKILGAEHGSFFTGVIGGLASSTATTLSLSKFAHDDPSRTHAVAAGIIAANVMMVIRIGFILAAVSRGLLLAIWPVLAAGAAVGAGAALVLWLRTGKSKTPEEALELGNPLEIKPALVFAFLLAVIAVASRFGADQFGQAGLIVVGLVSGLADVDALTLTAGRQAASSAVEFQAAGAAILAAAAANIAVKAGMASAIGGRSLGMIVGVVFAAVILAGAAVYLMVL